MLQHNLFLIKARGCFDLTTDLFTAVSAAKPVTTFCCQLKKNSSINISPQCLFSWIRGLVDWHRPEWDSGIFSSAIDLFLNRFLNRLCLFWFLSDVDFMFHFVCIYESRHLSSQQSHHLHLRLYFTDCYILQLACRATMNNAVSQSCSECDTYTLLSHVCVPVQSLCEMGLIVGLLKVAKNCPTQTTNVCFFHAGTVFWLFIAGKAQVKLILLAMVLFH